jgi:hypothetical protein
MSYWVDRGYVSPEFVTLVRSGLNPFSCCCGGVSQLDKFLNEAQLYSSTASREFAQGAALATDPNNKSILQQAEQASIDSYYTANSLHPNHHHPNHHISEHNHHHHHHHHAGADTAHLALN